MRKQFIVLLSLIAVLCLSACGIKSGESKKASEQIAEIATGSAVSAVFKNSDTTEKTHYLENDFMRIGYLDIYEELETDDGYVSWVQENLDDTGWKPIEIEGLENEENVNDVLWLTNDWVYCCWEDRGMDAVCRIPVHENESPVFDMAGREDLFTIYEPESSEDCYSIYELGDMFVTDSYIFYYCEGDRVDSMDDVADYDFFRYDFRTGTSSQLFRFRTDDDYAIVHDDYALPLVVGDCFFLIGDNDLYAVSFDTLEKTKIYSGEMKNDKYNTGWDEFCKSLICRTGQDDGFYISSFEKNEILQYDGQDFQCVLDADAFSKLLETNHLQVDNALKYGAQITNIFTWNDRLYLCANIEWVSQETVTTGKLKGKTVKNEHGCDVIFSANITDFSQWEFEEELWEYIQNNFSPDNRYFDKSDREFETDTSQTLDRDFFFYYHAEDNKVAFQYAWDDIGAYYIYDLDTKTMERKDEDVL